jgi:multiple sugar transport system substrate-binding protein
MPFTRRDVLKAGTALAVAPAMLDWTQAWSAEQPFKPEAGAKLRFLRWSKFLDAENKATSEAIAAFTQVTGIDVRIENEWQDDIQTKAAIAVNVGSGPDIVWTLNATAHLFPDKLLDVTDVADYLGKKYGGWYPAGQMFLKPDGKKWIGIPLGAAGSMMVYRESQLKAAGFDSFPKTTDDFLKMAKAVAAKGTPGGMALGNATGDGLWCNWLVWAFGGKLVDANNKVVIDSPETLKALEYGKELYATFIPGTLSWLDPTNNLAFLTGQISLTYNAISIYYVAKTSTAPHLKAIAADIQHAHLPIGPVGRPTELAVFAPIWIFNYTRFPNAAREYLRFMLEREQYELWERASLGYFSQPLRAYESDPMWSDDPKCTPFRDGPGMTLHAGYAGKVGAASAASAADFIVVNMVAEAATGQSTPQAAAARAEQRARRYYKS